MGRKRLKEARIMRNMTVREVADTLGCSVQSVFAYESGTRDPKIERMSRFAELYGTTVEELFFLKEEA